MARVNHGVDMPGTINDRLNAEPVGRVMCITSGAETGLLYRLDNGERGLRHVRTIVANFWRL